MILCCLRGEEEEDLMELAAVTVADRPVILPRAVSKTFQASPGNPALCCRNVYTTS